MNSTRHQRVNQRYTLETPFITSGWSGLKGSFFKYAYMNLLSSGLLCLLMVPVLNAEHFLAVGEINVMQMNVRSEPTTDSAIVTTLKKGAIVGILSYHAGWVKVSSTGHTGYIRNRSKYLHITTQHPRQNIDDIKETASEIQRDIEHHQSEIDQYTAEETELLNSLDMLERTLNHSIVSIASLEGEISTLNATIAKTNHQLKQLVQDIDDSAAYASERLVALYKLNLLGKMHILASAESIFDLLTRKTALEKILVYDQKMLDGYTAKKSAVSAALKTLNEQKQYRIELESDLKKTIQIMVREKEQRAQLLATIQKKKSLGLAAVAFLKQAASALDQTIMTMHSSLNSAKKITKKVFSDFKGLLKMPVKGRIVSFFGPYKNTRFNITNFRNGIEIKAEKGARIKAVSNGHVIYADWFKGYGNMIILDHGDNYYTVYAHAHTLLKSKGDNVKMSEVIATVGDTASMVGSVLYFEVRHHGKPMDPLEWLQKG